MVPSAARPASPSTDLVDVSLPFALPAQLTGRPDAHVTPSVKVARSFRIRGKKRRAERSPRLLADFGASGASALELDVGASGASALELPAGFAVAEATLGATALAKVVHALLPCLRMPSASSFIKCCHDFHSRASPLLAVRRSAGRVAIGDSVATSLGDQSVALSQAGVSRGDALRVLACAHDWLDQISDGRFAAVFDEHLTHLAFLRLGIKCVLTPEPTSVALKLFVADSVAEHLAVLRIECRLFMALPVQQRDLVAQAPAFTAESVEPLARGWRRSALAASSTSE